MPEPDTSESDIDARDEAAYDVGGDEDLLDADDIGIPRDADGSLKPEVVHVDRLGGAVESKPIRESDFDEHVRPFVGGQTDTIDDDAMAYLLNEYVVAPDLTDRPDCPDDGVTATWVGQALPQEQQVGLLIAMLRVGGYEQTADRLAGDIPDAEQDLIIKAMKDEDVDLGDAAGNGTTGR